METNRMSAAGSPADRALEFSAKIPVSPNPASPSENRRPDAANIEKEITAADSKITERFLQELTGRVNDQLQYTGREVNYIVHEKTGQYVIRILDSETKEVVREIPPEKNLDAVARMWEMMGILVDKKV